VIAYWNQIATNTVQRRTSRQRHPGGAAPGLLVRSRDGAGGDVRCRQRDRRLVRALRGAATTATAGASLEAAAAAAAYHTLKGLFPNRTAQYQTEYDNYVGSLQMATRRRAACRIGQEVAVQIVALRADDGRWTPVTYTPTSLPGRFRGNQSDQHLHALRASVSRCRAPRSSGADGPAAAHEFRVCRGRQRDQGPGAAMAACAPRNNRDRPLPYQNRHRCSARNLRIFATADRGIAENARTMAVLWTASADATIACSKSKSTSTAGGRSARSRSRTPTGNAATEADPSWTPVVPTPNHPEYPAAHSCVKPRDGRSAAATLRTKKLAFDWSSGVTGTTTPPLRLDR